MHDRCGYNKPDFIARLKYLYNIEKLSISEIANKLINDHHATFNTNSLHGYFIDNNIKRRSVSEAIHIQNQNNMIFTASELEIIYGILLGDGSMIRYEWSASLEYKCKHFSVCQSLNSVLPRLGFYHPHQNKSINWYTHTSRFTHLLPLRDIWYPGGKRCPKIVPRNFIMTPETGYWWYLGDGSSARSQLRIATCNFTIEDVEYLQSLLPVYSRLAKSKDKRRPGRIYPVIVIGRNEDKRKWLDYIGPCRHPEYAYRWILK